MTHLSSLTLGITCGTLFYIRKYKHTKKTSAMYSIITILLVVMCLLYTTFGILGLLGFFGLSAPRRKAQTSWREKGAELWLS